MKSGRSNIKCTSEDTLLTSDFQKSCVNEFITSFINNEFDIEHNVEICESIESIITEKIIGSRKIRFGNYPLKLTRDAIYKLICSKISKNEPIPLLVPIGPHKAIINENVDIAEVCALKTLNAINKNVSIYYKPGLKFYLREEDLTGFILSGDTPEVRENIEKYLQNLETLISILGYDKIIIPFRESGLSSLEEYNSIIQVCFPIMKNYIKDSESVQYEEYDKLSSYAHLNALGWNGLIPIEQREFYRDRFRKIYSLKSSEEIDELMVSYFSVSFARAKLGAVAPNFLRKEFIQLSFVPPIPGVPNDINSKRVYYRTLPVKVSRIHLPFWRANGFLKLNKSGVKPSLTSWGNSDLQLHKHTLN